MADLINVTAANAPAGKIAFWEQHPDHPAQDLWAAGEPWLIGGQPQVRQVARTHAVEMAILQGRLAVVEE